MENKDLHARKEGVKTSTIKVIKNKHTNPNKTQTIKQLWVLHRAVGQKKQTCTAQALNSGVQGGFSCGSCYSLGYGGRQTNQSTNTRLHPLLVL